MPATLLLLLLMITMIFQPASSWSTPVASHVRHHFTRLSSSSSSSAETSTSTKDSVFDADAQAARQRRSKAVVASAKQKDDPEWQFFDTARLCVAGGAGGNGCVAFRREKGEPRGGPSGGRGGDGGSVTLVCDASLNTLGPLRQRVHVRAKPGRNGMGKKQNGVAGRSIEIAVPPGTVVRDLQTQKVAGELRQPGDRLVVARGGRGGRGNAAFMTPQRTSPKLAEKGEPATDQWLSVELKLVADVGFLGKPNAGKSTLLAASSAAKPKIANYPFTTVIPNLGVCDLDPSSAGLVLCDIPGLIHGAAGGAGMGGAFLRHVQRCKVLLHVIDGTSDDPLQDFEIINQELRAYDPFLADKPQVVVLNKLDVPQVQEKEQALLEQLRQAAGHSRVLSISAATTANVATLMRRLRKFVDAQPEPDLALLPEIDLSKSRLDYDSDDFTIQSDPAYPGQWRVQGRYMEQIAKMTHWEYPQAIQRFGRQMEALGISTELAARGAVTGDLIMIGEYDFTFSPGMTNPYIPPELLQRDELFGDSIAGGGSSSTRGGEDEDALEEQPWRPFPQGGFLDVDTDELVGFGEMEDWDLLDDDNNTMDDDDDEEGGYMEYEDDEVWIS